jgi:hypothetical protein
MFSGFFYGGLSLYLTNFFAGRLPAKDEHFRGSMATVNTA